ncbi:uncharacterized protein LOC116849387 isoform X2 [Odontomachus brunneus]|uniref:uncharacterized protein LOC116849387 isoform X2 n=1 Tax=Odontomachus brunneus TaxID=486640 RepID=UPI0013F27FCF|nr:uncharacterized protein LOC116849387 isoform X2 [Odontomachus brunneus]
MLTIQRSDSLRGGEGCNLQDSAHLIAPVMSGASVTMWKPAERSVSFNRDVHVKRIGRGAPRVTAALAGDGEGRLIVTPIHKESITARSKEDLAQEAALVLQQAGSLQCVAHDNRRLPGRFSTLPARRNKKRPELPLDVRRRGSEEIGATTTTTSADLGTPRAKKKPLERSASDASAKKLKGSLARFFSPKLERRRRPVGRSASDAGTWTRSQRKRSGSESEGSHLSTSRAKKQLSPIIEASPQIDQQQPFHFGVDGTTDREDNNNRPEPKKPKRKERASPIDADHVIADVAEAGKTIEETRSVEARTVDELTGKSSPSREAKVIEHRIFVEGRDNDDDHAKEEAAEEKKEADRKTIAPSASRTPSPTKESSKREGDEVDGAAGADSMLHSSRYDLQQRDEQSTIHKMIHRLSNDRSPPPQLTRTMVSPSPGFGHNNNRPFSYTRPNDSCSPPPVQSNVIYAQVQPDKKKAQRSHSDSDEGLGLERKDSSRENSPAEKEYRRTDYSYSSDLRRNNEINSFKSRYEEERQKGGPFGKNFGGAKDFVSRSNDVKRRHEFEEIDRRLYDKPEKYTSTVFVDTSGRGRADGMDARRRDSGELLSRQNETGISNKTSELSARRDLLESRIKSRLLADEMFAAKSNCANVPVKKSEHEIIDKPIVPSPVTPNRIASPKRYMDTYITETRTNSNGEKYIFEKEIHEDNGKVYGYEKKITNKIPTNGYLETSKPRDGYTLETRTDKYGDKYIVETRTHEGYSTDNFKPFLSDRSRTSPEDRFQTLAPRNSSPYKSSHYLPEETTANTTTTNRHFRSESRDNDELSSPIIAKKLNERKFSKSDDFLDRDSRPVGRDAYLPKTKRNFESIRGMSKSTQRLDEVGENARVRALRGEYTTRSHENLSSVHADYVNARDMRRPLLDSPTMNGRRERSPFAKRHLDSLREGPNDDYDTDISQMTSSQLESKYYKETRTTQRYTSGKHPIHDDYDSSPPRIRTDRGGYNSSRYDSDTTARDSIRCETRYDETSRTLRKEHRKLDEDPKKPLRRSRNRLDYFDDSDSPRGKMSSVNRLETFDESPTRPPRTYHEGKSRHARQEVRGHIERRHRETRLSDPDRKDRLADSGIENDYRRDSQEVDRREQLESEDEGFVSRQFIKHERRHTDRNMNLTSSEQRKYDKYVNDASKQPLVTAKPPSGADKKYEKKATKKSGTMSKVKQLFSKKEKKAKEEKGKKSARSGSSGALTDDEVTMRYREYRGDQLRSAKSARDLGSDIQREDYSQRRRLSTPSGSPSPPRPTRLSRSTGTLTREESFCESSNTLTRDNQGQEAERKGWFKSLSRKNKSNATPVDKKSRILESEILTTGTEDEEASSTPERVSVQKNLRFFGDTDQESVSSNRDRRNKTVDSHACSRRDVTNSTRHNLGIMSAPRKPPRLAESALSSGESTTGDSSQQSQNSQRSQRSVVYLHAATVGEIPGPNERRRAASREELNRPLQSHTRTVSRSVSVLAPWKPRHYREPFEINYDQQQQHAKPIATMRRRQRSRETLSRRGKEARRSTINRSTLKSKDKQKVDRTVSTESGAMDVNLLSSEPELSRSTSVPRDPNKNAGWFKLKNKKSRA